MKHRHDKTIKPREAKPFTRLSCQPGDILRFEPDAERESASNKENFK